MDLLMQETRDARIPPWESSVWTTWNDAVITASRVGKAKIHHGSENTYFSLTQVSMIKTFECVVRVDIIAC